MNRQQNEWRNVMGGIALVAALHFAAFWVYCGLVMLLSLLTGSMNIPGLTYLLTGYRFLMPLFLPGLMQVFYVVPAILWFRRRRQWGIAKGLVIGAVITALLNGGCFLLLSVSH